MNTDETPSRKLRHWNAALLTVLLLAGIALLVRLIILAGDTHR
jgi:hypothetical protein